MLSWEKYEYEKGRVKKTLMDYGLHELAWQMTYARTEEPGKKDILCPPQERKKSKRREIALLEHRKVFTWIFAKFILNFILNQNEDKNNKSPAFLTNLSNPLR